MANEYTVKSLQRYAEAQEFSWNDKFMGLENWSVVNPTLISLEDHFHDPWKWLTTNASNFVCSIH